MSHEEYMPDSVDLAYSTEALTVAGSLTGLGCPDCGGSLWQSSIGSVKRYQCHVGHAFVAESLIKNQSEAIERHLWTGLRLLREHAVAARQLAEEAREQQRSPKEIEQIEAILQQALHQAEILRQVLLSFQVSPILENHSDSPLSQQP